MLLKTSTMTAPWTVVEGDSKPFARTKILKILVDKLSQELSYDPFSEATSAAAKKEKKRKKKVDKS